jgi:hypothetical protein
MPNDRSDDVLISPSSAKRSCVFTRIFYSTAGPRIVPLDIMAITCRNIILTTFTIAFHTHAENSPQILYEVNPYHYKTKSNSQPHHQILYTKSPPKPHRMLTSRDNSAADKERAKRSRGDSPWTSSGV